MHTNRRSRLPVALMATITLISTAATALAQTTSPEKERELLAVLRSDAPAADKAITCKLLAIHGSSQSVPDLAKLLPDPQLASWARIALEAIPGPAADEALRTATDSLQGRLLIGTINSLGVRRDAGAVDRLTTRLKDRNADVASAAAVALGHIGNPAATQALRGALAAAPDKVRSAVAEGCVLCAERLLAGGDTLAAIEIYDEVRNADVPQQRIIEATRGAILARNDDGIPLLLEQFRSPDKRRFQLALGTAREFPGGAVDPALAAELDRATPDRAALIVQAMADRPETVVLSAVLTAARQGNLQVRLAAINALARVGDDSCLSTLLQIAAQGNPQLTAAAKATLSELPGEKVNAQIVERLPAAEGDAYPLLLELVGQRRINALPLLLKALEHADEAVRSAALTALGETVALEQLSVLISAVVDPKDPGDATVAQKALQAACVRMPDREACAAKLANAIERSRSVSTKCSLLEIVGAVGGTKALATVGAAAKSANDPLQDTSSRLLGEWMTADAAPVLLDLAKTAPAEKYQVRALRGYIRIARQFVLPMPQRVEMCEQALAVARRTAEKKLVIDVLKRYPSRATLQLAIKTMQVPDVKSEATQAALAIAQKVGDKGGNVRELLVRAGFERVKLEIVKAEYGAGSDQKDVTAILRKQASDSPLIVLPASSFNASFGGDPLPGVVKRLKIRYRINGQAAEATFAENALIILPVPK